MGWRSGSDYHARGLQEDPETQGM